MQLKIVMLLLITSLAIEERCSASIRSTEYFTIQLDSVPFDPLIKSGRLPNGFTYYLRRNNVPEKKIEMRLVVKAGIMNEDDDQLELAHLIEHMGSRSTKHFPNGIRDFFESEGLRSGTNFNASTGFSTNYKLMDIPSESPELLYNCLKVQLDRAQYILLDSQEARVESGAVLAEMSMGDQYSWNVNLNKLHKVLNNDKYSPQARQKRCENIKHFNYRALLSFYKKWYHPESQALIIVGDIDVAEVEHMVKSLFSVLSSPTTLPLTTNSLDDYAAPLTGKNQFIIIKDKKIPHILVEIFTKKRGISKTGTLSTVHDYKQDLLYKIYNEIMNVRFRRINQQHMALFNNAHNWIEMDGISNGAQLDALITQIKFNNVQSMQRGFQAVITELAQISQDGFSIEELNMAKDAVLRNYNNNNFDSKDIADRLVKHFEYGSAVPSASFEKVMIHNLANDISLDVINSLAKDWIDCDQNRDIVITASDKIVTTLPNEATILNWLNESKSIAIRHTPQRYKQVELSKLIPLEVTRFDPNIISYESSLINEIGVTQLKLNNGVSVILKPIKITNKNEYNTIRLQGLRSGGTILYKGKTDYSSAIWATSIVNNSGIGSLSNAELQDYLSKKDIKIRAYMNDYEEGIIGSSLNKDFESLMQLVHLYFVSPNKDINAFNNWLSLTRNHFNTLGHRHKLNDTLNMAINGTTDPYTYESLNRVNFDKAFKIYQERFCDASDFTFVIVGEFDIEKLKPILLKYLGSLPTINKIETHKITKNHKPKSKPRKIVLDAEEGHEYARIQLIFQGSYNFSEENNIKMLALKDILQMELTKRLREKEGGTYYVLVTVEYFKLPKAYYDFRVQFSTDPDRMDKMVAFAIEEIDNLKTKGPSQSTFNKTITRLIESHANDLNSERFWFRYLTEKCRYRENFESVLHSDKILKGLNIENLRDAANQYLNFKQYKEIILL